MKSKKKIEQFKEISKIINFQDSYNTIKNYKKNIKKSEDESKDESGRKNQLKMKIPK